MSKQKLTPRINAKETTAFVCRVLATGEHTNGALVAASKGKYNKNQIGFRLTAMRKQGLVIASGSAANTKWRLTTNNVVATEAKPKLQFQLPVLRFFIDRTERTIGFDAEGTRIEFKFSG